MISTDSATSHTGPSNSDGSSKSDISMIVFGSSLGTAFEWYDFFVYGTLATVLGPLFFTKELGDTGALLASLATYGTGLLARPIGSAVFGSLGDRLGRKRMFVWTVLLMGLSTALVGVLPTYETAGRIATVMLVALRCVQVFALGGEYGGAAVYVAEHAPAGRRGYATGWVQLCATVGFFLSLVVVLTVQRLTGDGFRTYGWWIPFLVSALLVGVSVYIRMRFAETPVFARLQSERQGSPSPLSESFLRRRNLKMGLLALFGLTLGAGIVWYTSQFYALIFMQKTLKADASLAYGLMAAALLLAMPFYAVVGYLSDRFGRKPVVLAGFAMAIIAYIPLFQQLTHFVNPGLEAATAGSPASIVSNDCRFRLFSGPQNDCERIKDFLLANGVQHVVVPSPSAGATLRLGDISVTGFDVERFTAAIRTAGYPERTDPNAVNYPMALLVLFLLALCACASYGVLAAYLVELFPARIRYTAISMPYHVGVLICTES